MNRYYQINESRGESCSSGSSGNTSSVRDDLGYCDDSSL